MQESEGSKPPGRDVQLRFPLPTGTRVDHYVIREVLGAGGFGITYLAEHEALGKLYAIKEYFPHAFSVRQGRTVRPTSSGDGTYKWGLDRFVTEARALAKFKHPAIVDVTSIFEANGTAYIVLAYEAGVDMTAWLKRLGRPPSQVELDGLLKPLLDALEEVHRHNMMHRDISPDNVLVRDDGRPVLIDFGSAREQIRGRARALSAIVKHGYSPPEQYTSKPELQGPWTDIYALAATLYRAIADKLPPDATERFVRDELAPISQLARAPYRPGFLAAIDRGLRLKVEDRPQTIVEWREQLFRPEPLRQPLLPRSPTTDPAKGAAGEAPAKAAAASAAAPAPAHVAVAPVSSADAAAPPASKAAPVVDTSGVVRPRGSSIPASERPDLSWIEEADPALPGGEEEPGAGNRGQTLYNGILGAMAGAVGGGLFSIVLASAISTACFADTCIFRYLAVCAGIGAVVGAVAGMRLARSQAEAGEAPAIGRGPGAQG
jgi:serine/threonine protein kinase